MLRAAVLLSLFPAVAMAAPFAKVVNGSDEADGNAPIAISATAPDFAQVTDERDTLRDAPPPPMVAAPVGEPIGVTEPIAPVSPVEPSPTMPPLVKREVEQSITRTAPDTLLVQPASDMHDSPMATTGMLSGRMFNDRTETLTPQGILDDQPDPEGTFSFGGSGRAPQSPAIAEPLAPTAPSLTTTVETLSPTTPVSGNEVIPVKVINPSIPLVAEPSPTTAVQPAEMKPLAQPIAGTLSFMAQDTNLSAVGQKQLNTFIGLAGGNTLKSLTITQRTAAPLEELAKLAQSRREGLIEALKTAGLVTDATRISEVRLRTTSPNTKVTLVGN